MYITNNPDVALIAEKYGVARVWIDLETIGKKERQRNMDTVKSTHTVEDVRKISKILTKSELLVRINPWNENSEKEINDVIEAGAQCIMLPMWKTCDEVDRFFRAVNNRVPTILLLETKEAVECIDEVLEHPMLSEIHIGLNDLHLSYKKTFMFELLADGLVEELCNKMKNKGIKYGFGGVACIGEGLLPSEKIVMEHYRLGSKMSILSRSFCKAEDFDSIEEFEESFRKRMFIFREYEHSIRKVSEITFKQNIKNIAECVDMIVNKIKEKTNV